MPEAHFLEAWSDARGYDGTASIVQPLIAPLYGGKSAHELLVSMSDRPERSGYDSVRDFWRTQSRAANFEEAWRRWLHDGVMPDTAFGAQAVTVAAGRNGPPPTAATPGLEIVFRHDPSVLDGRYANNGWLQVAPKPITRSPGTTRVLRARRPPID